MTELHRFSEPITAGRLARVLADPDDEALEPLGLKADLGAVYEVLNEVAGLAARTAAAQRAGWDTLLVQPLHTALRGLPRRVAADMRLWHRLSTVELQSFVWYRWLGHIPEEPATVLTEALTERFLGTSTLHGVSRNALARLYWCAETLYSERDGYLLVNQALSNQDFFQAIFERDFGLYAPAARACLKTLWSASEEERRDATRRLNHYLTTIAVEGLGEEDIARLLTR